MAADNVAGEAREFGLVSSWLRSANLSYAASNFDMAGIVTPRSFSGIQPGHFEALGVTRPDDRKRLFYLVHEVKKAIERGERTGSREKGGGMRWHGGDGDENENGHDDGEYASDGSQSPPGSNCKAEEVGVNALNDSRQKQTAGDEVEVGTVRPVAITTSGEDDVISTVELSPPPQGSEPISPVTLSSPIAASAANGVYSNNNFDYRAAAAVSGARGEASIARTVASGAAVAGGRSSAKERLERELERRASRRVQERNREKERKDEEVSKLDLLLADGASFANRRSSRRKSFLPSVASKTSRRSSVSSYRAVALSKKTASVYVESKMDELNSLLLSSHEEDFKSSRRDHLDEGDAMIAATPKGSSVMDVGSRQSSIVIHQRSTVKVTNATRGIKGRRYSSIPRTAIPPLDGSDDEEKDAASAASETSDLSTSVSSFPSLASVGTVGTGHSKISIGLVDENRNYNGNVDRRRNSMLMAAKLGNGGGTGGGGSVASSSRVGKKLSTIPSSSVAPLSPLMGLTSAQLDESIAEASSETGVRNPPRRRSNLGAAPAAPADNKSVGTSSIGPSSRPGTVDFSASSNHRLHSSKLGSPGRAGSYPSRPSSRGSVGGSKRQRKKLNVSATSSSASVSSVRRLRRLKSPTPRNNDPPAHPRSISPARPSSRRISARATSPKRTQSTPRSPYYPGGMSLLRNNNRSATPKRTMGVVGTSVGGGGRPMSPVRSFACGAWPLSPAHSPMSHGAVSPKRSSPRRARSPSGGGSASVFVHGLPKDDSWATQVAQLRRAFDLEHMQNMEQDRANRLAEEEDYEMRIRVIVRKRPMSKRESSDGSGEVDIIQPLNYVDYGKILVHQPKTKLDLAREVETSSFAFDNVFGERSNNVEIYQQAVSGLIPGLFRGKWASVFAYGQTGSGKTFTMMGSNATGMRAGNQAKNVSSGQNPGLYFLAAQDVFRIVSDPAYADATIGVSLFEIYGGKLLDLLNARHPVRCLEDSKGRVNFPGLSEHPVNSAAELMNIIDAGALNRSTGTTSANADSSRSHAVLQLSLRRDGGRTKKREHGRLTFIDLAGSERGADTSQSNRMTRMEGAEINTSLLALKEVIRALATGSSLKRIPFRGSKLTQVLKESFVGKNSRTVMVSCLAPNITNCDHTLNTLRYADRVKERDPQTGKLSASVAASSKIKRDCVDDALVKGKLPPRPLTAPAASFRLKRDESSDDEDVPPLLSYEDRFLQSLDECLFVGDNDEYDENAAAEKSGYSEDFDCDKFVNSDENDSLDEVLKSTGSPPIGLKPHLDPASGPQAVVKDNPRAQSLIATHKSIMSELLQMLQHEMILVNDTDANRDNIDEYLKELDNLSGQQLSLISTLRESLASYNASKNTSIGSAINMSTAFNRLSNDSTVEYDSSFDLRD